MKLKELIAKRKTIKKYYIVNIAMRNIIKLYINCLIDKKNVQKKILIKI